MIDRRQLRNPFGRQVERGDRRILNRAKHRAVAMGVQLFKRPDNRGVADREAEAPAGHIKGLGKSVGFHSPRFGVGLGEEAQRRIAGRAADGRIGKIVQDRHLVTTSKLQRAGEQRRRGKGAGWIMRVVKHHQTGFVSDLPGDIVKIRQELILSPERQAIKRRLGLQRRRAVNRIAGIGGDEVLPGAEQRPRDAAYTDMRPLKHGDFAVRIEFHIILPAIEPGDRLADLWFAPERRVAMVFTTMNSALQRVDYFRRGGLIRTAAGKIDQRQRFGVDLRGQFFQQAEQILFQGVHQRRSSKIRHNIPGLNHE